MIFRSIFFVQTVLHSVSGIDDEKTAAVLEAPLWLEARYVFMPCILEEESGDDGKKKFSGEECTLVSAFAYPDLHQTIIRIFLLISKEYTYGKQQLKPLAQAIKNKTKLVYCVLEEREKIQVQSVEFPPHSLGRNDVSGVLIECRSNTTIKASSSLSVALNGALQTKREIYVKEPHQDVKNKIKQIVQKNTRPIEYVFILAQIYGDPSHLNQRLAYEYIQYHTFIGADLFLGTLRMCNSDRTSHTCKLGSRLEDHQWLNHWAFNQTNTYFIDIQKKLENNNQCPKCIQRAIYNNGAGVYITLYELIQLSKALQTIKWIIRIDLDEWLVSQTVAKFQFVPKILKQIQINFPQIHWIATLSRLVAAIAIHPERTARLATQFTQCFFDPNSPAQSNQCNSSKLFATEASFDSPLSYNTLFSNMTTYISSDLFQRKFLKAGPGHSGTRGKWIARADRITYGNSHHAGPGNGITIPSSLLVLMHFRSIGVGDIINAKNVSDIEQICQQAYHSHSHCIGRVPKYCGIGFCCLRHCDWLHPVPWPPVPY